MAHTPEPWEVHHWGDHEIEIVAADGKLICDLAQAYDPETGEGLNKQIDADGQLIAAAPKMLRALKKLAEYLRDEYEAGSNEDLEYHYLGALNTIKAAEGPANGNAGA